MPSPNEEQSHILDVARKGDTQILAINALAGTGKTTTLTMLADVYGPYAGRDIKYFTFNAHAAADAKKRFGRNVEASTAHSFAFRSSYPGMNLTMREVFANRLVDHGFTIGHEIWRVVQICFISERICSVRVSSF